MNEPARRIDVHHHLIPPAFAAAMARRGLTKVAGAPLPAWRPQDSLAVMDLHGIATAITSLSAPGVHFADGGEAEAIDLARACNDYAAEMAARHPGRFGNFAVLPMPFTEAACREAGRALDELHADGIVLLGSTDGHFLGDVRFEALLAELDRRQAVVFVHPNLHATSETLGLEAPGFLIEFLCDTSRAALNLILSGSMHRYPRIRWILAHAGGFLPYIAWRCSLANVLPEYAERAPLGVLEYVRRFYFDTALSPSPFAMACLAQLTAPEKILFGSDFPFAPALVTGMQAKALQELSLWDAGMRTGVDRSHALALFPRLAAAGEAHPPAPVPRREGLRERLRRAAVRPALNFAERVRNR